MDKKELPFLTASQLSNLIETKEVSPVEATEAYLDRIEEVDPKLNSYITITGEQAFESARQAEQEIAAGKHRGPLHGVPMAVKETLRNDCLEGFDTSSALGFRPS